MGANLQVMGVDTSIVSWTGRSQIVHLGNVLSDVVVNSAGAPQGAVLCPYHFNLYTTDLRRGVSWALMNMFKELGWIQSPSSQC